MRPVKFTGKTEESTIFRAISLLKKVPPEYLPYIEGLLQGIIDFQKFKEERADE